MLKIAQQLFVIIILIITALNSNAASSLPIESKHAMVVTTQHYATRVGIDILKHGGNAIDAAVAIGYALAVVEPCCGNIGGGGFMLIHLANGKNTFINFREKAPLGIKQNLFKQAGVYDPQKIRSGYLSIAIPGTVMGLNYAVKKYGTMSLSKVMQPAINLAKNGFILNRGDIELLTSYTQLLRKVPHVAAIFLKNDKPLKIGDRLVQKNLAHTLALIAANGNKGFYWGSIANTLVIASRKHGGVFSLKDFHDYTVQELTPITCNYQGYQILSSPPPSSGGITLCQMLNILADYPLRFLGFHSAASVHYQVEAMRYAYADRNRYLGDPDFIKMPIAKLLSPKYAAAIRRRIQVFRAGNSKNLTSAFPVSPEKPQTTSYAVVDQHGNAVVVTYTLNGYFGSGIMVSNTGFFLNNEMDDFTLSPGIENQFGLIQGMANAIAPGKRPLSSMTPTLVFKNHKLFMAVGAAGGSTIITQILAVIQNVINFGMNIQKAINAPRIHMQWLPDVIYMEPLALSPDTQQKLKEMGYRLRLGSPYQTKTWGLSVAILKQNNQLFGAVDTRWGSGSAQGI